MLAALQHVRAERREHRGLIVDDKDIGHKVDCYLAEAE